MYRKLIVIVCLLVVFSLTTTIVLAGRMRFNDVTVTTTEETGGGKGGGKNSLLGVPLVEARGPGKVTIKDFLTLFARGFLTGLGNLDVEVELTATAETFGNITCTNHGQQLVEAQPRQFEVVNVQFIPRDDFDKNGSTSFNLLTEDFEPQLSPGQFCPNDNWSAEIDGLVWLAATVTATQPDGQIVTAHFVCSQPAPDVDAECQRVD